MSDETYTVYQDGKGTPCADFKAALTLVVQKARQDSPKMASIRGSLRKKGDPALVTVKIEDGWAKWSRLTEKAILVGETLDLEFSPDSIPA